MGSEMCRNGEAAGVAGSGIGIVEDFPALGQCPVVFKSAIILNFEDLHECQDHRCWGKTSSYIPEALEPDRA